MTEKENDPLIRQLPDEPRFVILARDWSGPELVRIWLAIRKRDVALIDVIVRRIKAKMENKPFHPKDAEHVLSASDVAMKMDLWLIDQTRKPMDVDGVATESQQ